MLLSCWYGGTGTRRSRFRNWVMIDHLDHSQIFPNYATPQRAASRNSALAKIKERWAVLQAAAAAE
jgi:hypothetical protein